MTQKLNACVSVTPEAGRCSGCGAQWCVCGLCGCLMWQCAEALCSVLVALPGCVWTWLRASVT